MAQDGLMHLLVHGDMVDTFWPAVEDFFASAIDRAALPEFTLAKAYIDIKSDAAELWIFNDETRIWGIVVGKFIQLNGFPVYDLYITAGDDMHRWLDKIEPIEERARELGAKRLDISGRRGWVRMYRNAGFKELYTTMGKEL